MIRIVSLLVFIPVVIIVATFAYRNAQLVSIDLFTSKFDFPLAAVLLISLFVGVVIGFFINIVILVTQKNKIRQLTKQRQEMTSLSEALKTDSKRL